MSHRQVLRCWLILGVLIALQEWDKMDITPLCKHTAVEPSRFTDLLPEPLHLTAIQHLPTQTSLGNHKIIIICRYNMLTYESCPKRHEKKMDREKILSFYIIYIYILYTGNGTYI